MLSSHDVTFVESVCFYRLHPHRSSPVPLPPLSLVPDSPPVAPLPPLGPAPSGVSQVDPPSLVEPLEFFSDTSGPAEGGDLIAADTVAPRRSARLAVPPGFPPRPSSPPLQPIAVDSGAAGGGDTRGADSGGAGSGGAECPTGIGGAGGAATGGPAVGGAATETLLPERLREWAVRWGSPGGGAGRAGAEGTGPGGASAGVPGVGRARCYGARGTGTTGGTGAVAGRTGSGGTGPGGAHTGVPGVGGTGGADTGGATGGIGFLVLGASRQESLLPTQLREWVVRWGSPGGGAGDTGSGIISTRGFLPLHFSIGTQC
ncbi:unnamed protein product [Closterium sp. NIES-54]